MISEALRLFIERGYEGTRIEDIAQAAGVAVQTVYYTFGTKARLLAEVEPFVILGDRPDEEWADAPWVERLRRARSAHTLIEGFVDVDTEIKGRHAAFILALGPHRTDAGESPERQLHGRDAFFAFFVDRLQEVQPLRAGQTAQRAVDILVAVDSLENYIELTQHRGWSNAQWKRWLAETISTQFLPR